MIHKKICIFFALVLLFSTLQAYADNLSLTQSDDPMEITSDRMEAFNEKKMVVFSGNAKAVQGKNILKSEKLFLYYKNEPDKKEKIGTVQTDKAGELEKIEAKGNVSLTQGDRVATGDEAVYYRDTNKVIMTGNATLREGKNTIKGDRVIVYLNENRGVVESNAQNQVKAVIFPKDTKKTQTK